MAPKLAMAKPAAKPKPKAKAKPKAAAAAKAVAKSKTKGKSVSKPSKKAAAVCAAAVTADAEAVDSAAAAAPAPSEAAPPAHIRQFERGVLQGTPVTAEEQELKAAALRIKAMPAGSGKQELYRELVKGFRAGGTSAALQRLKLREQVVQTRQCAEEAVAVPLALMVGQCGGNVALFQEALKKGDVVEVVDPKRPAAKLYQWRQYRSTEATAVSRTAEKENSGDAEVDFSMFESLDLDLPLQNTGVTAVDVAPELSTAAAAAPRQAAPLALADATAETKLWLKVNDAVRVGQGVVFKAKLAVRSLGKTSVAKASGVALQALIGQAEAALSRLQDLSLQHSAGELLGQVDTESLHSEVREFHTVLAELHKGEKSALALKDK